jgi:hypothetical protein
MTSIRNSIKAIAQNRDEVYSCVGKVIKVNGNTIDVDPVNGDATIFDVRLQANIDKTSGILIKPKKGSYVIVSFINKNVATVTGMAEIDSLSLKVGNVDLSTELADVFDKIDDLISIVQGMKVLTPAGPSTGLTPDLIPKIIKTKTDFKLLKQRLTTIITPL